MISEEKKLSDKVKLLQEQVARLTDKLKDQIEINKFLRKVNLELQQEKKCECDDGEEKTKG
jgi:hypothetical protein